MKASPRSNPVGRLLALLRALDVAAFGGWQSARARFAGLAPGARLAACLVPGIGVVGLATLWLLGGRVEPMTHVRLTDGGATGQVRGAALSPDGATLAYADGDALHRLDLATLESRELPLPAGAVVEQIAWSGERIYFAARQSEGFTRSVWVVPANDGPARLLLEKARSPAISADGERMAFVLDRPLGTFVHVLDLRDGEVRRLHEDPGHSHMHPAWADDGRLAWVRVTEDQSYAELVSVPPEGGEPVAAVEHLDRRTPPLFAPDGRLIFGRTERDGASLWSVRLAARTGTPVDPPVKIFEQQGVAYFSALSTDRAGRRLGVVPVRTQVDTYVAELDQRDGVSAPRRLASGTGDHFPMAWTDDGTSLLIRNDREGRSKVVVQAADGDTPRTLAEGLLLARAPDGRVLFEATDGTGVMGVAPEGGTPEPLTGALRRRDRTTPMLRCASRAGGGCILAVEDGDALRLHAFDSRAAGGQGPLLGKVGLSHRDYGWNVSPRATQVAVVNGGRTIKLVDLAGGGVRKLTIQPSLYTHGVAYAADGRSLYVTGMVLHSAGGYALYRVDLAGRSTLLWQTADRWFDGPVPSPDGKTLALAARTIQADAWMLENF